MGSILSNLQPAPGSRKKRKRVGRGQGSGRGKTSTRGQDGQLSRSGAKFRAWFEGGQMPLQRRIPKFGFKSPFKIKYQVVNVGDLEKLQKNGKLTDNTVTPDVLVQQGMVRKNQPVKILGDGELKSALNVTAHAISKSAREKITAIGGKITIIKKL